MEFKHVAAFTFVVASLGNGNGYADETNAQRQSRQAQALHELAPSSATDRLRRLARAAKLAETPSDADQNGASKVTGPSAQKPMGDPMPLGPAGVLRKLGVDVKQAKLLGRAPSAADAGVAPKAPGATKTASPTGEPSSGESPQGTGGLEAAGAADDTSTANSQFLPSLRALIEFADSQLLPKPTSDRRAVVKSLVEHPPVFGPAAPVPSIPAPVVHETASDPRNRIGESVQRVDKALRGRRGRFGK